MKHVSLSLSLLALLTLFAQTPSQAQVTAAPAKMTFQGRLSKPDGTPVADGTYSVRFSLHDALAGGTEKWSQTLANVSVRNGTFAVLLDVSTANLFNTDLWLEIKIGNDAALSPRQSLVSVPYALKANTVPDGSLTADKFVSGAFNNLSWLLGGNSATNPATHFLGTTDAQPLVFKTNNTERLRIDNFGRVGIGTDTPTVALDVTGDIRTSSVLFVRRNDPNGVISYLPQGGTGAHEWWVGAMRSGSGIAPAGSFSFFDQTAGATRLSLDSNGNVGIGNNTPGFPLSFASILGDKVSLWGGPGNNFGFGIQPGVLQVHTNTAGSDITFGHGSSEAMTEVMRIKGTGHVGIGTATPQTPLDVNGTARMTGFQMPTGAGAGKVLVSDAGGNGTWGSVSWSQIAGIPGGLGGAGNTVDSLYATVAGGLNNAASIGFATVSGGTNNTASGANATVGGGASNTAGNSYATVAGGTQNLANGSHSTIAGGNQNTTSDFYASIGGGTNNTASGRNGTIGGGGFNIASGEYSTVGGGTTNTASNQFATVAGGDHNTASGRYATVGGGTFNTAGGTHSFAAGRRAKANHDGSFVWADTTDADFASTANNQFNVRASGGARIYSNSAATTGVVLNAGAGSWSNASDRNLKSNFQNVDTLDVLEKLVSMPLTTWNYTANSDIRHIGPMAQDFWAAFGRLGMDDKHIDTVDADGVAFAAIQGLNQKLEAQNAELKAKNADLEARLQRLETILLRMQK